MPFLLPRSPDMGANSLPRQRRRAGRLLREVPVVRLREPQRPVGPCDRGGHVGRTCRLAGRGLSVAIRGEQSDGMATPMTRYARSGDANIAYQVVGQRTVRPHLVARLDLERRGELGGARVRALPHAARVLLAADPVRQARHGPVRRRLGRAPPGPRAAHGRRPRCPGGRRFDEAAVFGASEGGNLSILFAATYPDRVRALVLAAIYAKRLWSPDYPWAPTPDERARQAVEVERAVVRRHGPGHYGAGRSRQPGAEAADHHLLPAQRQPRAAAALLRMNTAIDTRSVPPHLRARRCCCAARATATSASRRSAGSPEDPAADAVELPGDDHLLWIGDTDALLDEVEVFLTGERRRRPRALAGHCPVHRHRRLDGDGRRARRLALARPARAALRPWPAASWSASPAGRSTPPETASSRPSTVRHGPSVAPRNRGGGPRAGAGAACRRPYRRDRAGRRQGRGHRRPHRGPRGARGGSGRGPGVGHGEGPRRRLRAVLPRSWPHRAEGRARRSGSSTSSTPADDPLPVRRSRSRSPAAR